MYSGPSTCVHKQMPCVILEHPAYAHTHLLVSSEQSRYQQADPWGWATVPKPSKAGAFSEVSEWEMKKKKELESAWCCDT